MSDGKKYYCFCGSNCKYETMTKEQILAAITQAVETGSVQDVDTGFVSKLKEKNSGRYVTFWVGTRAEYNAIETREENCMYIFTDDTTTEDIAAALSEATKAAEDATAAAAAMQTIDISDKVTLTITEKPVGLTTARILDKEYKYNPALGVVFFVVNVAVDGTFTETESLTIQHSGGYKKSGMLHTPCVCNDGNLSADYYGTGNNTKICIEGNAKDTTPKYSVATYISGWYFCNGEG